MAAKTKTLKERMEAVAASAKGKETPPQLPAPKETDYGIDDDVDDIAFGPEFLHATIKGEDDKVPEKVRSRISIMHNPAVILPEIMAEIFLQADADETPRFAQLFARGGCYKADSPDEADIVVFGGGEDVDPSRYGEKCHNLTFCNKERDAKDFALFEYCVEQGIPMIGVCRGAQLIHVGMGGKLYQDVDNHHGHHSMTDISVKPVRILNKISSVHHQAVIENLDGGMEVIGISGASRRRIRNDKITDTGYNADIEAFFYREICALGVQGHPEYMNYDEYTQWFLQQVEACIMSNPDTSYSGGKLRLRIPRKNPSKSRTLM